MLSGQRTEVRSHPPVLFADWGAKMKRYAAGITRSPTAMYVNKGVGRFENPLQPPPGNRGLLTSYRQRTPCVCQAFAPDARLPTWDRDTTTLRIRELVDEITSFVPKAGHESAVGTGPTAVRLESQTHASGMKRGVRRPRANGILTAICTGISAPWIVVLK